MENIDPQVEAERLRQVRALIEDLLREADICASVSLAGRAGRFEDFIFLNASWSVVRLTQTPQGDALRIKSKLADYNGDRQLQVQHQAWSAGAVHGLGSRRRAFRSRFLKLRRWWTSPRAPFFTSCRAMSRATENERARHPVLCAVGAGAAGWHEDADAADGEVRGPRSCRRRRLAVARLLNRGRWRGPRWLPYGVPGDRLWVREAWRVTRQHDEAAA